MGWGRGWILSGTSEISQSGRLGLNLNMQMGTGNGKQPREKIAFKYLHNKQQLPQTYNAMVKMAKYSFILLHETISGESKFVLLLLLFILSMPEECIVPGDFILLKW